MEIIREIKSLSGDLTIILGVNENVEKWKSVGDFIYEERIKIPDPKIQISDSCDCTLTLAMDGGPGRIGMKDHGGVDRFMFSGIETILQSNTKELCVESMDYLIATEPMDVLLDFFKDVFDIVVQRGGKVCIHSEGAVIHSPLLSLLEESGLESDDIFVDRENERKIIKNALEYGSSKAILISGKIGIGKTTLVTRARTHAALLGYRFIYSRSYYNSGEPYLAVWSAFKDYVGSVESGAFEAKDTTSFGYQRTLMFYNFAEGIRKALKTDKIMVFFDDMHWMDSASLKLVHYLVSNLKDEPIVFVGAYRSEDASEELKTIVGRMVREGVAEEISLNELGYEDTKSIIEYVLNATVPDSFARMLHEKSGGNPLFTKELLHNMLANGQLAPERGVFPRAIEVDVPSLIEKIVESRLRRLNKEEKELVEIASVIGNRVDPDILLKVSNVDEIAGYEAMERIDALGIWSEDESGEAYIFNERIIRDGIYNRISKMRRRALHRKIAAILEENKREEKYYGDIAHHFMLGRVDEKAHIYFIMAGDYATKRYAHENAIEFYLSALSLNIGSAEKLDIYERLGNAYNILGEYDMAAMYFLEAHAIAKEMHNTDRIASVKMRLAETYRMKGRFDRSMKELKDAMELINNNDSLLAEILCNMAWNSMHLGDYSGAIEYSKKAVSVAEGVSNDKLISLAYHVMGTAYSERGDYEEALKYLKIAVNIRERTHDEHGMATSYNNLGSIYYERGHYEEALKYFTNSYNTFKEMGYVYGQSVLLVNIGSVYEATGELDKAMKFFDEYYEIVRKLGYSPGIASYYSKIGRIERHRGNLKISLEYGLKALDMHKKMGEKYATAESLVNVGSTYLDMGKLDEAEKHYTEAKRLLTEMEDKIGIADIHCGFATLHQMRGDIERAKEYAEKSITLATELHMNNLLWDCYTLLAEIYGEANDEKNALDYIEKADKISKILNSKMTSALTKRTNGYVLGLLGHHDDGITLLENSILVFENSPYRGELGLAYYYLGIVLKKSGKIDESLKYLEKALDIFTRCGYELLANMAGSALDGLRED